MRTIIFIMLLLFAIHPMWGAPSVDGGDEGATLDAEQPHEDKPFIGKHILSFDLKALYYSTEDKTAGVGFGVTFERQILPFLSVRAEGAENIMWSLADDIRTDVISITAAPLFYPFSRGLDWLYMGCGISTEFFTYRGDSVPSDHEKDTITSLVPQIGWKQNLFNYVMLDLFFTYKIEITDTAIPDYAEDMVDNGFGAGLKFKINLSRILRKVFKRKEVASGG